jgi:hypothetical protein
MKRTLWFTLVFLAVLAPLGWPTWCLAGPTEVVIEIRAGDYQRQGTLVSMELPPSLRECRQLKLLPVGKGNPAVVQVEATGTPRAWWLLSDTLPAGSVRKYRLVPSPGTIPGPKGVTVEDDGKHLFVKVQGKPVLTYNEAVVPPPNPKEPYYAKSGYIHPVHTPSGEMVTDDFNPDHPHQHGIMFAWRKTTFEGRTTNGWDQKDGHGRVEHVKTDRFGSGPVFGFFTVQLRQVDLLAPDAPRSMLNETWNVRTYNRSDCFLFDLESEQVCATRQPVVVDKMDYGALMLRGRANWTTERTTFEFLTSEGKRKATGNLTRPRWVDLYGPAGSRFLGAAILDHPQNFRFPQPVRLAPTWPYFCFTPATLGSFTIEPAKTYRYRYRFVIHDGKPDAGQIDGLWNDYAHPPVVRTVTD